MAGDQTVQSFLDSLRREMGQHHRAIEHLEAQARGIARRMEEERERIKDLERSIGMAEEFLGVEAKHAQPQAALMPKEELQQGSVADMAEAIMAEQGGATKVALIARRLIEAGKYDEGEYRQAYATTFAVLTKDKRFAKVDRGEFTLSRFESPSEQPPPSEQFRDAVQRATWPREPSHP